MSPDHHRQRVCVSSAQLNFGVRLMNLRQLIRNGGEGQAKARPLPQLTLYFHCASVLRHDLADDHQAQSGSMTSIFGRVERIKDMTHYLRSHPSSGIREIDHDALRLARPAVERGADPELTAFGHRVEAVVDEIQKQLLQTV